MEKTLNKRFYILLISTILFLIIIFAIALMVGRYPININDFFSAIFTSDKSLEMQRSIISKLRLPRTIVAMMVGIGLSLCGVLYQETFKNKLVSPDLLGVSTGASVGAALAIVLGLSSLFISVFAFVAGVITVLVTVIIAKLFKNGSSMTLLLSGIIVGGFMSAILSLIKYFADPQTTLASITYWLMGSFENATMNQAYILIGVVGICSIILIIISFRIYLVALGKTAAQTKGLPYNRYRYLIVGLATLLTAISVCFCGTISWIGLVIPHIVRLLVGHNTRRTIPLCITFGGSFMILTDILSRTFTDSEIPLSAVTGLFGTIVFVIILIIRRRNIYEHQD